MPPRRVPARPPASTTPPAVEAPGAPGHDDTVDPPAAGRSRCARCGIYPRYGTEPLCIPCLAVTK